MDHDLEAMVLLVSFGAVQSELRQRTWNEARGRARLDRAGKIGVPLGRQILREIGGPVLSWDLKVAARRTSSVLQRLGAAQPLVLILDFLQSA